VPSIEFSNDTISAIVSNILNSKTNDKNIDTSHLEYQIDQLVYQLYDLTEEEIKIVERNG